MKNIFNKIQSFCKKNKIIILILLLLLILLVYTVFALGTKKEKEDIPSDVQQTYQNYTIDFTEDVVSQIDDNVGEYTVFEIDVVDHFDWVKNFVDTTKKEMEYTEVPHPAIAGDERHYLDQTLHNWQLNEDLVTYDVASDLFSFEFEEPVRISGIQINPNEQESVERGLSAFSEKFFSEDFEYIIDEIYKHENLYVVKFRRVVENIPVFMYLEDTYLVLTSEGHFKSGKFLLAEFTEVGKKTMVGGLELKERINEFGYEKVVAFDLLNEENYSEYSYIPTGEEGGNINLENVELVYYYRSKFDEVLKPVFIFEGKGYVSIEGEELEADFYVRTE